MNDPADREVAIFGAALQLPAGQRATYLDEACAGDAALRQRVEAFLAANAEAGDFLESPAPGGHGPAVAAIPRGSQDALHQAAVSSEKVGDRIGRYKLLQQIGEGGCGVVYMAEQEEPMRRKVALKVIKLGMDTRSVIARFEAERQALALMDHPNIAKVLDAGATETGRPYFVMELVRGIRITDYCDQNNLSTRDRLELFTQVCRAIQHAHQKGVIHRDVKPSNILVTVNDGLAVPMVIDFGIAKATQGRLTDQTLFTAFEQFLGTPAYMSPEQAVMTNIDIDTRSDIYSLGVLLYELLTGKTPFDAKELLAAGLDEMRRTIREKEPARPSTRLGTMQAVEVTIAAKHRQTDPPKLIHLVLGDLDWIVMKALEKDRARRYETANGLAMDVQRHLDDEPVVARPPGKLYLLQKLLRRHKLVFAAAGTVTAALLLGLGVSTWLFVQENEARHSEAKQRLQAVLSEARARNATERAETALAVAKKTLELSDLAQASHLSLEGHPGEALPYLVRILSANPTNDAALTRLLTLLAYHSWMVPLVTVKHSSLVSSVRFSPDGQRIVTASYDHTARVWDAQTGQALTPPLRHDDVVESAEFSPNGKWIVTASRDRAARIWDARTGQLLAGPLQHGATVYSAEFSPDSKEVVTASDDKSARVWDAQTGVSVTQPLQHNMAIASARFSPDGHRVVTASDDGTAQVWDAESGERTADPLKHGRRVSSAQFSPDGRKILTASFDQTARVWDARTGQPLTGPIQHGGALNSAKFSPDGKWIVTASRDKTARVWDAGTGQALTSPLQHNSMVTFAEFSPDGQRILTSCLGGGARMWDARTGQPLIEPSTPGSGLWSAQFSPDGKRIATASRDQTAVVWNVRVGQILSQPFTHLLGLYSAHFSPDGRFIVTASWDKTARVWDALRGTPVTGPLQHDEVVVFAQFSPDGGRVVTASADHTACLWDAQTGRKLVTLKHDDRVCSAQFSPDGKWVATASKDGTARVWDTDSGLPRTGPLNHADTVFSVQFSPDGKRIVTGSKDSTACVWDAASGRQLARCAGHTSQVTWAEFSPDGKLIVTASIDRTARVLDAQTGLPRARPLTHTDTVSCAHFSPDGKWIVTGSADSTARIWDAQTGLPRTGRLKHNGAVNSVSFSPDGQRIVTTSADHTARIWDAENGLPISEPFEHAVPVYSGEFSPDGARVVIVSADKMARIWDLAPAHATFPAWLLRLAEAVSGQALGPRGALEDLNVDRAEMFAKVRKTLAEEPGDDDLSKWGRWFLADPATRTISPYSKITVREYLSHRLAETTAEGLDEVQHLADLGTAESICREALAESLNAWPNEPAQWQSSLSSVVAVLAREHRFEEAAQVFSEALRLPASPNLMINGSFEFGTFADANGMYGNLFRGAYNITGWTVVGPPAFDLGWMEPQNPGGLTAADGIHFLNLTGAHDSTPYTGVSQTIRTVVGRSYNLSFAVGSDVNYDRSILPSVAVEITGNPTRLFTVSDVGTNRWQVFNSSFTASNTDTILTFTGANSDNIGYIGLDNVIVTAATNSASGLAKPKTP